MQPTNQKRRDGSPLRFFVSVSGRRINLAAVAVLVLIAGALQGDSILRRCSGLLRFGLLSGGLGVLGLRVTGVTAGYGIDHVGEQSTGRVETLVDLAKISWGFSKKTTHTRSGDCYEDDR
jgi:hypothetical protein